MIEKNKFIIYNYITSGILHPIEFFLFKLCGAVLETDVEVQKGRFTLKRSSLLPTRSECDVGRLTSPDDYGGSCMGVTLRNRRTNLLPRPLSSLLGNCAIRGLT